MKDEQYKVALIILFILILLALPIFIYTKGYEVNNLTKNENNLILQEGDK